MSEGDYVRTEDGIIDQVIIEYNGYCASPNCNCKHVSCRRNYYDEDKIIKSSPNIIDLVEVGDILVIKDFVDEACMIFTDIYLIQNEQQLLNIKNDLEKNKNKKLYSIVTKEQFSCMEYKIGE